MKQRFILGGLGALCLFSVLFTSCDHSHKYLEEVMAPTCTEEGSTLYLCEECGYFYEDNIKKPLGHDLVSHEGKEATCTEAGYKKYSTCKRCSYTTYETIPALNHSYKKVSYEWTEDKSEVLGIIECDHDSTHIITEKAKVQITQERATCEAQGKKIYTAEFVNSLFTMQRKEEILPIEKHDIVQTEGKAPTCTEPGYEAYESCKNCEYSSKVEIPFLGHDYDEKGVCKRCKALEAWVYLTFEFVENRNGYMVTGVAIEKEDINIPETYNNLFVIGIKENAFANHKEIKSINIPNTVDFIGKNAFANCTGLTEISIPDNAKEIKDNIFAGCSNLISLSMPNLKSMHLAEYFSQENFLGAYNTGHGYIPTTLTNVTLVGGIIEYTFSGCLSLEKVVLNGVTSIAKSLTNSNTPFKDCPRLKELWLDSALTNFGNSGLSSSFNLYYKGTANDWAKIKMPSLVSNHPLKTVEHIYFIDASEQINLVTELNITDSTINEIGYGQFIGFKDLNKITFSPFIMKIGAAAFLNCSALKEIKLPQTIHTISTGAFSGCSNVESIDVCKENFNDPILYTLFGSDEYTNSYRVGAISSFGKIAYAPKSLVKIIIHGPMTLSKSEFRNMTYLKEVVLDSNEIPATCFENCINLESVVLKNLLKINSSAFNGIQSLKYVFYRGSKDSWNIVTGNSAIPAEILYFYSETLPESEGLYWHYIDDVPTLW